MYCRFTPIQGSDCRNRMIENATDAPASPKTNALLNPKIVRWLTKRNPTTYRYGQPTVERGVVYNTRRLLFNFCFRDARRLGFVEKAHLVFARPALYPSRPHDGIILSQPLPSTQQMQDS